jgi:hypothetical protein
MSSPLSRFHSGTIWTPCLKVKLKVTDGDYRALRKFPRLLSLVSDRALITDEALAELTSLLLEELNLCETRVTDAGIPSLVELTRLKKLDLRRTAVTAAGVAQLPAAAANTLAGNEHLLATTRPSQRSLRSLERDRR